ARALIGVTILFFAGVRPVAADPVAPPELGIGSISLVTFDIPEPKTPVSKRTRIRPPDELHKVDYLHIRIYCSGNGRTPTEAGRYRIVEMREFGKTATIIHSRRLPALTPTESYALYVRVPNDHFTTTTTIRVRFTEPDSQPSNDSLTRTFYRSPSLNTGA